MTDRITRPGDSNADWLRAVIDTAVDGVILIDSGGRILIRKGVREQVRMQTQRREYGSCHVCCSSAREHAAAQVRGAAIQSVGPGERVRTNWS